MNDFSTSQDADGYCKTCQQANLFYLGPPPSSCELDVAGQVNGLMTPMLPAGKIYPLQNTQPGTTNRLELTIGGRQCLICNDIRDIGLVGRPEDLKVALGTASVPAFQPAAVSPGIVTAPDGRPVIAPLRHMVPIGQVSSARMMGQMGLITAGSERNTLDVMSDTAYLANGGDNAAEQARIVTSIQAHPSLGPPPFAGNKAITDLTPIEEDWLVRAALAVIGPVEWVNQITGVTALAKATGADMSLTGTNMPGVVIEVVETLLTGDKRRFLFEMYGQRIGKIWVNSRGSVLISFTGNKLLRSFVTSNVYGAANAKVSLIETAARTRLTPGAALKAVGSRSGVLSIGFVTFFDVAEWLSQPSSEREVNDLVATLLWDVAAVSISIIAGAIAAGAVLLLAPGIATAAVLVTVGIGFGVVVGLGLDWLDSRVGIKSAIRSALDNASINDLDPVFYNQMMIAP